MRSARTLPTTIFDKALYERRRSLLAWGVAIYVLILYVGGFYPVLAENEGLLQMFENVPASLRLLVGDIATLSSAAGFFDVELFNFFLPFLFAIVTIGQGLAVVVGEERNGTLDILLANPVSRTRHVLEGAAAIAAEAFFLALVGVAGIASANVLFDLAIDMRHALEAAFGLALLATVLGYGALAAGAWLGEYHRTLGVTLLFTLGSYFIYAYADVSEALERLEPFSVFHYYQSNHPILNGLDWGHVAVLVGVAIALVVLSIVGINRRDLGVAS